MFFTGPVFIFDFMLIQDFGKRINRGYGEAEMGVFIVGGWFIGPADHVQVTLGSHAKPGMLTIAERLRDGVETDDVAIKPGAGFQVNDIDGDVVEAGFASLGVAFFLHGKAS